MLGVVNVVVPVPPASGEPPVAAAYQSTVLPAATEALSVTVPAPQREFPAEVGAEGAAVTVTVPVVADAEHPKLFVAVTVYVVFTVGVTPVGSSSAEVNPTGVDVQLNAAAVEDDVTVTEFMAQYQPQSAM